MSDAIKLGVVGTGGIFGIHLKNLPVLGGNQVVAVCDIDAANREKHAKQLGARGYETFAKMFETERNLDAVLLMTPPTVRREVIDLAAGRGLPVFCEKPPACSLDDAKAIIDIVAKHKAIVSVGFMYRYFPAVDYLKQLIGDQPITLVESVFMCPAATKWNLPGWFYMKERFGGHILDQAAHVMDLVRFIAGEIDQVYTLGSNLICPKSDTFTIEDSSSTALRFASGATGCHTHSWSHGEFFGKVTLTGQEFRLAVELDERVIGYVGDKKVDMRFNPTPAKCSHHYEEMKQFFQAVRTKDASVIRSPFADAAKSLATVLAMNQSVETGQPVKVAI